MNIKSKNLNKNKLSLKQDFIIKLLSKILILNKIINIYLFNKYL